MTNSYAGSSLIRACIVGFKNGKREREKVIDKERERKRNRAAARVGRRR